jgi:mannose-6-phosphate isomerase-like protein (cupin superfamily)
MTAQEIIEYFKKTYPDKNILALPEDNPTEVICEIDPTTDHPNYDVAIAAIKESEPHFHLQSIEVYEVLDGELELSVGDKIIKLNKGDKYIINPPLVHSAKGNFTLVKATSKPGWTPEDHISEK